MEILSEAKEVQTTLPAVEDPLATVLKRISDLSEKIQESRKMLLEA